MKKIYVGNLDWSITNENLAEIFSPVGTVIGVEVIKFRESGKSRGFGFVEMATEEETKEAMKFDRSMVKNRQILVREALPPGQHRENELKPFFDFINSNDGMILEFVYKGNKYMVSKQGVDFVEKPTEQPIL